MLHFPRMHQVLRIRWYLKKKREGSNYSRRIFFVLHGPIEGRLKSAIVLYLTQLLRMFWLISSLFFTLWNQNVTELATFGSQYGDALLFLTHAHAAYLDLDRLLLLCFLNFESLGFVIIKNNNVSWNWRTTKFVQ